MGKSDRVRVVKSPAVRNSNDNNNNKEEKKGRVGE